MINQKAFKVFMGALATLAIIGKTYAVCPVCTVAVVGGVVLAEKYGIDNTITGVWIGGLTVSLIVWTINWLQKRKINFKAMDLVVTLIWFALIPVPLFLKDYIGAAEKTLWGIDKMILGMIIGAIVFYAVANWYEIIKKNNNGKAYFPFQRVVMPVLGLLILSAIFYFITRG